MVPVHSPRAFPVKTQAIDCTRSSANDYFPFHGDQHQHYSSRFIFYTLTPISQPVRRMRNDFSSTPGHASLISEYVASSQADPYRVSGYVCPFRPVETPFHDTTTAEQRGKLAPSCHPATPIHRCPHTGTVNRYNMNDVQQSKIISPKL